MKSNKKLAIIGGMGPLASSNWYRMLISICSEKYKLTQDEEYPEIYILSLSMKGWDETGIKDEIEVKESILKAINKCELLEVDFIIIACNTAHVFFDYLQNKTNIQIISIIDTCISYLHNEKLERIGILSTRSTADYGLYSSRIKYPILTENQDEIDACILSIQSGIINDNVYDIMDRQIKYMQQKGVQAIILGCTELPICIGKQYDIPILDTGKILLNKISTLLYDQ